MKKTNKFSGAGFVLVLVLSIVLIIFGFLLGRLFYLFGLDAGHAWSVLGDTVRNTSGLLAVLAASIAAFIAYRTNRTRAVEANRSNFKDRMQWAVQHVFTDNESEGLLAHRSDDQR
ncbi:MAG: hypothetical protein Q3965_02610 [Rothia sp. (in: high G+C Gram-positive bacteria)]|nr:hypothetical protein [Rothia sp. (in: high G+C Gram-positive bacteria)]